MNDIDVIGSDYVQGSFQLLPLAHDRVLGAHYFCDALEQWASRREEQRARWNLRAALTEFQGALDVLPGDFRGLGFSTPWSRTQQSKRLCNLPLVKVLRKLRNFTIHSADFQGTQKDWKVIYATIDGGTKISITSIFFDPIDREALARPINASDAVLEWFNRQAAMWPAHHLIWHAIYEASSPIAHFIAESQSKGA